MSTKGKAKEKAKDKAKDKGDTYDDIKARLIAAVRVSCILETTPNVVEFLKNFTSPKRGADLAQELSKRLRRVSDDYHFRVSYFTDPVMVVSPGQYHLAIKNGVATLSVGQISEPNLDMPIINQIIATIAQHNPTRLIINLEHCPGGTIFTGAYLLSAFMDKQFTWEDVSKQRFRCDHRTAQVYTGPITVKVGLHTYSMGRIIAYMLKKYRKAPIVGTYGRDYSLTGIALPRFIRVPGATFCVEMPSLVCRVDGKVMNANHLS